MTNRVLDIAEHPARLSAIGGRLRIESEGRPEAFIPFPHVAAVVCSHGQVTITQAVLAELAAVNAPLVACDTKHLPVAMMLPLVGHGEQTRRFQIQAEASVALRKRLWSEIVAAKVNAQGGTLTRIRGRDYGLRLIARQVRVGNATATEARAGRIYWQLLFDDRQYFRSADEDARNALLNYGYAVVRAAVARALCGAGLHPALALHHHNKYDPYPLANDLMEPMRPAVDEWVAEWCRSRPGPEWVLSRESKASVLDRLSGRFSDGREERTLFDWAERWSERLARCLEQGRDRLGLEEIHSVEHSGGVAGPEEDAERVPGDVAGDDV